MLIYGWDNPYNMIRDEIKQLKSEGVIIPNNLIQLFDSLDPEVDRYNEDVLEKIFTSLNDLEIKGLYTLKDIRQERPEGPRILTVTLDNDEYLDKLHGAWSGRACGCALGKPVEIIGFSGNSRVKIEQYLKDRDDWPLKDYFSYSNELICPDSCRENISYMEADDDIHYTMIALKVLERFGLDFTWRDIADMWNSSLPFQAICTAETQAILNYNIRTHWLERAKTPITPEFTSRFNNPYREWIGAQIRADGWAYVCPGNPGMAAALAYRDAHWTHRGSGIYGEMFVAAMIASAFVLKDPLAIITTGLSEIPSNCQLAIAVREAMEWFTLEETWVGFMKRVEVKYQDMSPVHTINNTLICCMALYYSKMNPDEAISIAVMAGLDTDCNGATVGSIVGASNGMDGFSDQYLPKLHDRVKPLVLGFQDITLKELAERTFTVWKKISG